jgi:hypothetical protein
LITDAYELITLVAIYSLKPQCKLVIKYCKQNMNEQLPGLRATIATRDMYIGINFVLCQLPVSSYKSLRRRLTIQQEPEMSVVIDYA